jgi:hypothetical protein
MNVEQYLLSNSDEIGLMRIDEILEINKVTPADAKIFMLWENRGLYLDREYFPDISYSASFNKQLIVQMGSPDKFYIWLKHNGFDYIYNARLWPWDQDAFLEPDTLQEFRDAETIYIGFLQKYGEVVFRRQGELIRIK